MVFRRRLTEHSMRHGTTKAFQEAGLPNGRAAPGIAQMCAKMARVNGPLTPLDDKPGDTCCAGYPANSGRNALKEPRQRADYRQRMAPQQARGIDVVARIETKHLASKKRKIDPIEFGRQLKKHEFGTAEIDMRFQREKRCRRQISSPHTTEEGGGVSAVGRSVDQKWLFALMPARASRWGTV